MLVHVQPRGIVCRLTEQLLGPEIPPAALLGANRHNAVPAEVWVLKFDGEPAALRFLLGKGWEGTPDIRPIVWGNFFARFDLLGLALAYDDSPDFQILQIEAKSPYQRGPDPA